MGIDIRFFSWIFSKFFRILKNTFTFQFALLRKTFIKEQPKYGLGLPKEETADPNQKAKSVIKKRVSEKQAVDKRVSNITNKLKYLKSKNPDSPEFLGSEIKYPKKGNNIFAKIRSAPSLTKLREEVDKFAESDKLTDTRKQIKKFIKRNRYNPDLRAISGIQIYNDITQSGLDQKKLDALQEALIEIANALHNGGFSIFNVSWFVKIYVKYLELLQRRISQEHDSLSRSFHWQIRQVSDELLKVLLQVTAMLSVKDHLTGLTTINNKLKGSAFTYDIISNEEIKEACEAIGVEANKNIGSGKTASYVVWVVVTLSSLFARIPMFRKLVADMLRVIPDISRDLVLQKNMVGTVVSVSEYQLAVADGNNQKIEESASRLYSRCVEIIEQQINYTNLTKPYEMDPFLKAAWIAKESEGLYDTMVYKGMLENSLNLLEIVIENHEHVKGSFELARQLQEDIEIVMEKNGWTNY